MRKAIIICSLLLAATAQAKMYKCGNTYQQTPCANADEGGAVRVYAGKGKPAAPKKGLSLVEFYKYEKRGIPAIGMTREQVDRIMGKPVKVNADNYGGVLKDQVIYNKGKDRWLVYTKNGIVENIQHRPDSVIEPVKPVKPKPKKACPTALEIRNAKVSASDRKLPETERKKRWDIIAEMERCGRD